MSQLALTGGWRVTALTQAPLAALHFLTPITDTPVRIWEICLCLGAYFVSRMCHLCINWCVLFYADVQQHSLQQLRLHTVMSGCERLATYVGVCVCVYMLYRVYCIYVYMLTLWSLPKLAGTDAHTKGCSHFGLIPWVLSKKPFTLSGSQPHRFRSCSW